jgi:murein DD-endopeptidase MepM/ murein hydrolase activator NlpD
MSYRNVILLIGILILIANGPKQITATENSQDSGTRPCDILPGDTWTALSLRYQTEAAALQSSYGHLNRQQQPVIGSTLTVPNDVTEQTGQLIRPYSSLLTVALENSTSPWLLARQNGLATPYRPALYRPLLVPGPEILRELPVEFRTLELSQIPAVPGQALGLHAQLTRPISLTVALEARPFTSTSNESRLVSLIGTGAFFSSGNHELRIQIEGQPMWSQPWRFVEGDWIFQELTLTGSAAEIDQASIDEERARLMQIWTQTTPRPQWTAPFELPIQQYLTISAPYGARRSYNGGPYRTYHEGVDFSAYGGTPVFAPAAGTVVLAELLFVRGGAVIIDHGLGVYSGYYHMSSLSVSPGQQVQPGDLLGEVGTTGLSTGNHLHWDLLINGVWVDAAAWRDRDMASWILEAWNPQN